MKELFDFVRNHGTKLLGAAQVTLAAITAVSGLIPEHQLKYWLAATGVLTAWRGFFNSVQNNS